MFERFRDYTYVFSNEKERFLRNDEKVTSKYTYAIFIKNSFGSLSVKVKVKVCFPNNHKSPYFSNIAILYLQQRSEFRALLQPILLSCKIKSTVSTGRDWIFWSG
jgi:hypothetical protein